MITVVNRTMNSVVISGVTIAGYSSEVFHEWQLWEDATSVNLLADMIGRGLANAYIGDNVPLKADGVKSLIDPTARLSVSYNLPTQDSVADLKGINPLNRVPSGAKCRVTETGGEYEYSSSPFPSTSTDDSIQYITPTTGPGYWSLIPATAQAPRGILDLNLVAAGVARTVVVVNVAPDVVKSVEVEVLGRSADGEVGYSKSSILLHNAGAGVAVEAHEKIVEQKTDAGWTGIAVAVVGANATITYLGSASDDTVTRGSWRILVLEN